MGVADRSPEQLMHALWSLPPNTVLTALLGLLVAAVSAVRRAFGPNLKATLTAHAVRLTC